MGLCQKCHAAEVEPRLLLEIQTLHIRDLNGERRVQAVGNFVEANVCRDCAQQYLTGEGRPAGGMGRTVLISVLLMAVGAAVLSFTKERPFQFFGFAALFCAAALLWSKIGAWRRRVAEDTNRTDEERLERAAWSLLVSCLPKKAEDSDLTYIPVTADLPGSSVEELVKVYDLLPAIARKVKTVAAERLQGKAAETGEELNTADGGEEKSSIEANSK